MTGVNCFFPATYDIFRTFEWDVVLGLAKSLSENPGGSERNNRTGKVNHVQEVHLLFFPANEQAPKAIHP